MKGTCEQIPFHFFLKFMMLSAGGAAFPEQGEDIMSLCRNADTVLYKVKQNGKADFKMKGM